MRSLPDVPRAQEPLGATPREVLLLWEINVKTSYVPFANLITAAKTIQIDPSNVDARKALAEALERIEQCGKEQEAHAAQIAEARRRYASDDIEIDDHPLVSVGENGVFVNAWVFVPFNSGDEDDYEDVYYPVG